MPAIELPLGELLAMSPDRIVQWFQGKGVAVSWNWRDTWKEAHNESFVVAKATQLDVLADLRDGVQRIYAGGVSKARWKREMENILKARGWWGKQWRLNPTTGKMELVQLGSPWRLETIFRTNAQVAFNRGRYAAQWQMRDVRPYWRYIAVNDGVTRETHRARNGKVYVATSPIWNVIYPPNGFNCRCRVNALTPAELQRKNLQVDPDTSVDADGQFPDEGWDYNPAAVQPRVPPVVVPPELAQERITAQQTVLLRNLSAATERASAAGVDPVAVNLIAHEFNTVRWPAAVPAVTEVPATPLPFPIDDDLPEVDDDGRG